MVNVSRFNAPKMRLLIFRSIVPLAREFACIRTMGWLYAKKLLVINKGNHL